VSGAKRAREPTEQEVASATLVARLFAPGASKVLTRASAILAKAPVASSAAAAEEQVNKKARVEQEFNPFVAAMDRNGAQPASQRRGGGAPAYTANGAASLATTKAPVLDLFYHMARGYTRADTHAAMKLAWSESAERTLQVLCHARDCHGEGKGERLISYHALLWLRMHKPRTYIANLLTFLGHGYFKDILNLVEQIDAGLATRGGLEYFDEAHMPGASAPGMGGKKKGGRGRRFVAPSAAASASASKKKNPNATRTVGEHFAASAENKQTAAAEQAQAKARAAGGIGNSQLELKLFAEFLRADHLQLKKWRQAKKAYAAQQEAAAGKAAADAKVAADAAAAAAKKPAAGAGPVSHTSWFDNDDEPVDDDFLSGGWEDLGVGEVREAVQAVKLDEQQPGASASPAAAEAAAVVPVDSDVQMKSDEPKLLEAPSKNCYISLAAKWAPSEGGHYASQAKRLARILFGGDSTKQGGGSGFVSKQHMQSCMKKYRSLLSNLRGHLCLTERLVCANRWESVNFNSVPSKCHQLLKKAFSKHCGERYAAYLAGLKKGVGKINVTGLAPHELVKYYLDNPRAEVNETVEAAWTALVAKTKEEGTFKAAVAIVDVSGSMSGTPMLVAIALGILIAELTEGAYKGRVITFHESPSWFTISGKTLKEKVLSLASAPWGGSTNFQATFDLILDVAVKHKVKQNLLPQTLFCFSDMQFNQADHSSRRGGGGGGFQTNNDAIQKKWTKAGYKVPGIVYWNLNGKLNKDCPVECDTPGCALMSGFSASLLGVFLRTDPATLSNLGGVDADNVKPEDNPLHPLTIMMDSIGKYTVVVDPTEEDAPDAAPLPKAKARADAW
jgi:hypothetical protein